MGMTFSSLLGLIVLVADIWAIVNIVQSSAPAANKVVWVLVIFLLPILGLLIWLVAGPKGAR